MVCMRTIDVVFNNYESVDIVSLIDLCDNHVNDCLRIAQTVALESAPPLRCIILWKYHWKKSEYSTGEMTGM